MDKYLPGVDMAAELILELRRVQIEIADWNERFGYSTADHDIMAREMLARWRSIKSLLEKYEPKG